MDYLTKYYKNLSEQLQEQVNLLEAGLKRALRSGNQEVLDKEFDKTVARHKRILDRNIPLQDPNSAVPFERRLDAMENNVSSAVNLRTNNMNVLLDRMRTLGRKENEKPFPTPSQMAADMMAGKRGPRRGKPIPRAQAMAALGNDEDAEAAMMELGSLGYVHQKPIMSDALRNLMNQGYLGPESGNDLTPDRHDGEDPDTTADANEVADSQKRRQMGF